MRKVELSIKIATNPEKIISAFVNPKMLSDWWDVERSFIELKPGGIYSLAWKVTESGFGYISTGIIKEYNAKENLIIEKLVYFNPEHPILGPMKLSVEANQQGGETELKICQEGYQDGQAWDWYYEAVSHAWPEVIKTIKNYLETNN